MHTLIKLFFVGVDVDEAEALAVMDAATLSDLVDLNLLRHLGEGRVDSRVHIYPHGGLLFLCDFVHLRKGPEDPVYAPGSDSIQLADRGVRLSYGAALDLCTGTGIQATLAGAHSQRVTAVDINPRAVWFARLNLILNEIRNLRIELGDLYQKLGEQRFDYITANPPFVISPEVVTSYRDGGQRGDEILWKILNGLPNQLNDSGFCQIVTQLHEFEDASPIDAIRDFAQQHGFEGFLLLSNPSDKYKLTFGQFKNIYSDFQNYKTQTRQYLEHLDRIGFKHYYNCVMTLRKRDRFRFKTLNTLNVSIQLDLRDVHRLQDFYQIDPVPG